MTWIVPILTHETCILCVNTGNKANLPRTFFHLVCNSNHGISPINSGRGYIIKLAKNSLIQPATLFSKKRGFYFLNYFVTLPATVMNITSAGMYETGEMFLLWKIISYNCDSLVKNSWTFTCIVFPSTTYCTRYLFIVFTYLDLKWKSFGYSVWSKDTNRYFIQE